MRSGPPPHTSSPSITASLVCYRSPPAELYPLLQLLRSSPLVSQWIVVDNAAAEQPAQSAEIADLVQSFGGQYIASANIGFGAAHNLALAALKGTAAPFHLMVNPDILFQSNVLPDLVQVMQAHPRAGRVMPRVLYPDGREQHLCKLLPTPLDFALRRFLPGSLQRLAKHRLDRYELKGLEATPNTSIPFLSGCFVFSRWSLLRSIGGFDDGYFLYMEDVDLCRRMAAHADLLYWPGISVTHGFHRGSHRSLKLMGIHIRSSVRYFNRWGWLIDKERTRANHAALTAQSQLAQSQLAQSQQAQSQQAQSPAAGITS